jgi:hypothetical protein
LPEKELPQSINHKNHLEDYSIDIAVKYSIRVEIKSAELKNAEKEDFVYKL